MSNTSFDHDDNLEWGGARKHKEASCGSCGDSASIFSACDIFVRTLKSIFFGFIPSWKLKNSMKNHFNFPIKELGVGTYVYTYTPSFILF